MLCLSNYPYFTITYLCDKALLFTEEDKIVLGNVTEIGITSLHGSNDDTKESLPCVLNLRVPNIPMKTSLVQLVERSLLLMLPAFSHCFSKYFNALCFFCEKLFHKSRKSKQTITQVMLNIVKIVQSP